jgi:hypothetical protein
MHAVTCAEISMISVFPRVLSCKYMDRTVIVPPGSLPQR